MARYSGVLFVSIAIVIGLLLPRFSSWEAIEAVYTSKGNDNHQDSSRAGVGSTAYAVSAARAMESRRRDRKPIIEDKVANAIFDFYQLESLVSIKWRLMMAVYLLKDVWPLRDMDFMKRLVRIQDLVALRTKYFDEEICKLVNSDSIEANSGDGSDISNYDDDVKGNSHHNTLIRQLVTIGAGLDARVVRLGCLDEQQVITYELDFPVMLETKWKMFQHYGFQRPGKERYLSVECDFSLGADHWKSQLIKSGFDPEKPTVWLVEGVISYLEEKELNELVSMISQLSAEGSHMLATIVGEEEESKGETEGSVRKTTANMFVNSLHRFRTNDPCRYLKQFGECLAVETMSEVAARYQISPCSISETDNTYRVVKTTKGQ